MSEINSDAEIPRTDPLGLYIHVPFCASTCDFCAFYQKQPTGDDVRAYMEGIRREAALCDWTHGVDTVFWGGGTPGLLSPNAIRELGTVVHRCAQGRAIQEWSVEMAPASVTEARLEALREIGVNRISMGAQSFNPELLDGLGRQHTREQIFRAYDRIRSAGFTNVNIDLMFALPGQDEVAWLSDLETAVRLAPDHISTYCLTFEEDTKLWLKLSQGKVKLDSEKEARLYERTWERLESLGYHQYEVSNFARTGYECLHNLNTWRMYRWEGLGPSAASQNAGARGANLADLDGWLKNLSEGRRKTEDRVPLTDALLLEDSVIFGLRMNEGIHLSALFQRFPGGASGALGKHLDDLSAQGLLVMDGGRAKLTLPGRLVADAIGSSVLESMNQ